MKKRLLSLLLCLALICTLLPQIVLPASAATEGIYTYAISTGTATITDCDESASGTIIIPSVLGGSPVTNIGGWAFSSCSKITSVTIPKGVTSIGYSAFQSCIGLTSVSIPEGVTTIGYSTFKDCSGLTSVSIPEGVTSIVSHSFYNCSSLKSVTIPESVTSISGSAFYDCCALTSVHISDIAAWCNITFDDDYSNPLYYAHMLYLDNTLITDLVIPAGVTSIGDSAFLCCEGLTSVSIPEGVTSIGDYAFNCCYLMKNVYYSGSVTQWGSITIKENNQYLLAANIHYDVTDIASHRYLISYITPNCTSYGSNEYSCECGYTWTETVPKLDHAWAFTRTVAPTCGFDGYDLETCSVCGATQQVNPNTDRPDHVYNVEITDATCLTAGYSKYTCSICENISYGDFTPALGHDIVIDKEAVPATCTATGLSESGQCSRCDYKVAQTEVNALGHDIVTDVAVAPTCTETGLTEGSHCSRCNTMTVAQTKVNALGHDIVTDAAVAPTCTETGLTEGSHCSRCNAMTIAQEEIAALGHTWDNGVCSRCNVNSVDVNSYIDFTISAEFNHGTSFWSLTDTSVATITTHSAPVAFTDSGMVFYFNVTVKGLRPGTTDLILTNQYGMKVCSIPIVVLEHTHSYTDTVTPPSCTEQGYTTHTCMCGDSYQDTYVEASGHNIAIDVAVAPTCTVTGLTEGSKCSVCNEVLVAQAKIEALGHDWDEGVVTTAPTVTKKGVMTYTCTRCYQTTTEDIPETGEITLPFADVPAGKWFTDAVKFAYAKELFNGTSATAFSPNGSMTRGMLVTVLWRLDGKPAPEGENTFSDVKASKYYSDAVTWAAENGVVGGVGNGKFNPDGNVTREQIAAIMFRYADFKGYNTEKAADLTTFPDISKVSGWAKTALAWANAEELIGGTVQNGKTVLDPQGNATRAQVAIILMRYVENIVNAK